MAQKTGTRLSRGGAGAVGATAHAPCQRSPASQARARPRRQVSLHVTHPWVDARSLSVEYGRCGAGRRGSLRLLYRLSCSPTRSARPWREGASLASLVQHVLDTLAAHARAPLNHAYSSAAAGPERGSGAGAASAAAGSSSLLRQLSLDGSDALAERLQSLSTAELFRCITCPEDAMTPLLASVAADSEASAVVAELRASNTAAAAANLELAEQAVNLRQQAAIVRSTDYAAARARHDAAAEAAAALRERCATSTLCAALGELAKADEAEADKARRQRPVLRRRHSPRPRPRCRRKRRFWRARWAWKRLCGRTRRHGPDFISAS